MPSRVTTIHSRSAVGVYIDAFVGAWTDLHPTTIEEYRGFQRSIERAVAEMEAIKASPDYTYIGKVVRLENASAKAMAGLKGEQDRVTKIEKRIADLMATALSGTKPNDEDAKRRQREIRDRIEDRKLDPMQVMAKLLDAIAVGDQDFIAAVLDAPRAFPLLDEAGRKAALTAKIAHTPALSEELQTIESERGFYRGLLEAARQDIEAAASFGTPGPMAQGPDVPRIEDLAR